MKLKSALGAADLERANGLAGVGTIKQIHTACQALITVARHWEAPS